MFSNIFKIFLILFLSFSSFAFGDDSSGRFVFGDEVQDSSLRLGRYLDSQESAGLLLSGKLGFKYFSDSPAQIDDKVSPHGFYLNLGTDLDVAFDVKNTEFQSYQFKGPSIGYYYHSVNYPIDENSQKVEFEFDVQAYRDIIDRHDGKGVDATFYPGSSKFYENFKKSFPEKADEYEQLKQRALKRERKITKQDLSADLVTLIRRQLHRKYPDEKSERLRYCFNLDGKKDCIVYSDLQKFAREKLIPYLKTTRKKSLEIDLNLTQVRNDELLKREIVIAQLGVIAENTPQEIVRHGVTVSPVQISTHYQATTILKTPFTGALCGQLDIGKLVVAPTRFKDQKAEEISFNLPEAHGCAALNLPSVGELKIDAVLGGKVLDYGRKDVKTTLNVEAGGTVSIDKIAGSPAGVYYGVKVLGTDSYQDPSSNGIYIRHSAGAQIVY